jgi:outer membrane protein TolC
VLYASGRVRTALDIARNVRQAATLEVEEVTNGVALQVRIAYFRVGIADEAVAIAKESLRSGRRPAAPGGALPAAGHGVGLRCLRSRVERDNFEPPIIEARNAAPRRARAEAPDQRARLAAHRGHDAARAAARGRRPRGAARGSLERRAGLRALDEVIAAREGAVRIAQAAKRPTVEFLGAFAFQAFPNSRRRR